MKVEMQLQDKQNWVESVTTHLNKIYEEKCNHDWDLVNQVTKSKKIKASLSCKKCSSYIEYYVKSNNLYIKRIIHGSGYIIYDKKSFLWKLGLGLLFIILILVFYKFLYLN